MDPTRRRARLLHSAPEFRGAAGVEWRFVQEVLFLGVVSLGYFRGSFPWVVFVVFLCGLAVLSVLSV
jgi:hypothetical protein